MNNCNIPTTQIENIKQNGGYVTLNTFKIIQVTGNDRHIFLNSQLTHDIVHLAENKARFAGYCTAKGRLLANFLIWQDANSIYLMTRQDIIDNTIKRLSMFILRAKVQLKPLASDYTLISLINPHPRLLTTLAQGILTDSFNTLAHQSSTLIKLNDTANFQRFIWCGLNDDLQRLQSQLPSLAPLSFWDWLNIQAGEPWIGAQTVEKFIPQMLNFDAIDALSFKKGCYPGQEIVARSQYLGTLKRRMVLAHVQDADASCVEGGDVFADQSACGTIVNIAPHPQQGKDALIVMQQATLEAQKKVYLDHLQEGSPIIFKALPYTIPSK